MKVERLGNNEMVLMEEKVRRGEKSEEKGGNLSGREVNLTVVVALELKREKRKGIPGDSLPSPAS